MHAANAKGGTSGVSDTDTQAGENEEEQETKSQLLDEPLLSVPRQIARDVSRTGRSFTDYANAATLGLDFGTNSQVGAALGVARGKRRTSGEENVDRGVPVVKAALAFIREMTWKEEVSAITSCMSVLSRLGELHGS